MSACRRNRRSRILSLTSRSLVLLATMTPVAGAGPAPDGPAATVIGRIVRSDGPKYDIHVIDQETWTSVVTAPDGTFRFDRLPLGHHTFRIRSNYCDVQLVPVEVRIDQATTLEIELACRPRPCPFPDRADPTCINENPAQRARAGSRCEVHSRSKLKLDLVPVRHGIAGYTPGLGGDEQARFPNAHPWWSDGCVDDGIPFAEVAYCSDCRVAWKLRRLLFR